MWTFCISPAFIYLLSTSECLLDVMLQINSCAFADGTFVGNELGSLVALCLQMRLIKQVSHYIYG